jgi:hypothetical protein
MTPAAPGDAPQRGSVAKEPKFCRCKVCHRHFYGETIAEAHRACLDHQRAEHPDWAEAVCYCPD